MFNGFTILLDILHILVLCCLQRVGLAEKEREKAVFESLSEDAAALQQLFAAGRLASARPELFAASSVSVRDLEELLQRAFTAAMSLELTRAGFCCDGMHVFGLVHCGHEEQASAALCNTRRELDFD